MEHTHRLKRPIHNKYDDKKSIEEDMDEYINEWLSYDDLSEEDMMELLPYLMSGDLDEFDKKIAEKRKKMPAKKNDKADDNKADNGKLLYIPLPEELLSKDKSPEMKEKELEQEQEVEKYISCVYECDTLIAISKIDEDVFLIENDNYEIEVDLDQMNFLIESFNRIKNKPLK